jgi:hypothetical protein
VIIRSPGKCEKVKRPHAVKAYRKRRGVYFHLFFISALGGGEWAKTLPGDFTSRKVPRYLLKLIKYLTFLFFV